MDLVTLSKNAKIVKHQAMP